MRTTNYIFLLLSIFLVRCSATEKDGIKPKVQSLTESIYSSVTVQPDSLYQVFSSVNGILDRYLVSEGDLVSEGTGIAQIINTVSKLNSENAQVSLSLAQRNAGKNSTILRGIKDEIRTALLRAKNDSINFIRQQNLKNNGIGTQAELDARILAFQSSKTSVDMLIDKYSRTELELKASLKQARNLYKSAVSSSDDFMIKSKIQGKVYLLNPKEGELITTQTPIANIGSSTHFIIEMLIDEVDITKIELNQVILITLDAYKKEVFEAKISKIYPTKNERTQTFKIEGYFTKQPSKLFPGLTGEANIVVSTKKNILTIPNEYLNENNQVKTREGLVDVVKGISNMERVEIISGLDSSSVIYKIE